MLLQSFCRTLIKQGLFHCTFIGRKLGDMDESLENKNNILNSLKHTIQRKILPYTLNSNIQQEIHRKKSSVFCGKPKAEYRPEQLKYVNGYTILDSTERAVKDLSKIKR